MQVSLDPSEALPHDEWLRATPGAYEWWYFDAISENREYAFTAIWFLGNPFSPYHREASQRRHADPFDHNALFFALYRHGKLHAYHFSRFPLGQIDARRESPLNLRYGPSSLKQIGSEYQLNLRDTNANCRSLHASINFTAPKVSAQKYASVEVSDSEHIWRPAAPSCRVSARISLGNIMNAQAEEIVFSGNGYHDHNRGRLPFSSEIREWYWARAALPGERTLVVYHTRLTSNRWKTDLLLFERGALVRHETDVQCRLSRRRVNAFGLIFASHFTLEGQGIHVEVRFRERLDSAPFYLRCLCDLEVVLDGETYSGYGVGEYLKPHGMDWALTASAMKARIVEQ